VTPTWDSLSASISTSGGRTGPAAADWQGTATLEIGTEDYDTIALGKSNTEKLLSDQ
jgi:hypothetical protein